MRKRAARKCPGGHGAVPGARPAGENRKKPRKRGKFPEKPQKGHLGEQKNAKRRTTTGGRPHGTPKLPERAEGEQRKAPKTREKPAAEALWRTKPQPHRKARHRSAESKGDPHRGQQFRREGAQPANGAKPGASAPGSGPFGALPAPPPHGTENISVANSAEIPTDFDKTLVRQTIYCATGNSKVEFRNRTACKTVWNVLCLYRAEIGSRAFLYPKIP